MRGASRGLFAKTLRTPVDPPQGYLSNDEGGLPELIIKYAQVGLFLITFDSSSLGDGLLFIGKGFLHMGIVHSNHGYFRILMGKTM